MSFTTPSGTTFTPSISGNGGGTIGGSVSHPISSSTSVVGGGSVSRDGNWGVSAGVKYNF